MHAYIPRPKAWAAPLRTPARPFDLALSLALDRVILELETPGRSAPRRLLLRGQKAMLEWRAGVGPTPAEDVPL